MKPPRGKKGHAAAPTPVPPAAAAPAETAPSANEGAGGGPLLAPSQVDVAPKPVTQVMPVYPAEALKRRLRGNVSLRVVVNANGEPGEITVVSGAHPDLNDAAIAAARQWRFEPARKSGRPVRTTTTVRFSFEGVQFARTPLPDVVARTPTPTR